MSARLGPALADARTFVERRGSELDRLRLRLLLGEGERAELLRRVEQCQEPSGAVAPLEGGGGASLGSSVRVLEWLAALRLLERACAERAASWIASLQLEDGSFEAAPGSGTEARLQLSGRLAPLLAHSTGVPLARLEALGDFLARQWSVERVQGGRYRDLAPFLPFFAVHPHELSDATLQWCGRELERSLRSGRLSPLEAARLLLRCDARSLPGTPVGGREIVAALLATQHADGGFGGPAGAAEARVEDTLDAILALLRLA